MEDEKMTLEMNNLPDDLQGLFAEAGITDLKDFEVKSPGIDANAIKTAKLLLKSGEKAMWLLDDYYGQNYFLINGSSKKEVPEFVPKEYLVMRRFTMNGQSFITCDKQVH
ncbi:hypothetical protein ISS03_02490 [Patescibacteria group bacterium]|nr:hypothetical protein [Patescibacteria group bacterium]